MEKMKEMNMTGHCTNTRAKYERWPREVGRGKGSFSFQVSDEDMTGEGLANNDDDNDSDFDLDETDLESFSTVLESNSGIDEFEIFCISLQRTSSTPHPSLLTFDFVSFLFD